MIRKQMFVVYILLGLVMVQYQNCAQPESSMETTVITDSVGNDADGIDPVRPGEIFFPEKTVHVASLEAADLVGVCEQSGAIISWTLRGMDGLLIERGSSECDRGSFAVRLTSNFSDQCVGDMQLKAALGAKASSEVTILTDCNI